MPPNTVSVTRPGRWGNPFKVGDDMPGLPGAEMDAIDAVHCFELFISASTVAEARKELRGKDLACWCKVGDPCHGDVLLKIANSVHITSTPEK